MNRVVVLGVAGGSASGKSTVVREVVRRLRPEAAAVLRHDAYYHDLSHLPLAQRIEVNVDHPESLETDLLATHVGALLAGSPVEVPIYDFATQTRSPDRTIVHPAPVIVVEGILVLADERLRAAMDLKVFVHVEEEERLARRLRRDTARRGRSAASVLAQHARTVQPMHDRFVEPSRAHADLVIEEGGRNEAAIEAVVRRLRALTAGS